MNLTERQIKKEIVKICHLMHQKNYIAASDGNVSYKLGENVFLITPSGINKGFIEEKDIIKIDKNGKKIEGEGNPSTEYRLHIAVYEQRSDVKAIVHAHPPLAIAFSIAQVSLAECILPEVVLNLGCIPTTEYATPSSEEGPLIIQKYIKDFDAIILDRHGSISVGETLIKAYNHLEKIEHTALVSLTARKLGNVRLLSKPQINKLIALGDKLGLETHKKAFACKECGVCGINTNDQPSTQSISKYANNEKEFVEIIVNKVIDEIKK